MSFELTALTDLPKGELYQSLADQARALVAGEPDLMANAANLSSLIFHTLPELNWTGFYFLRDGELVVGPFQGKPACVRIALGHGVCGTAAQEQRTIVVPDVHEFPGHIACDPASRSEIVVPLVSDRGMIGVLDLDSPVRERFDAEDAAGLEQIVQIFLADVDTLSRT